MCKLFIEHLILIALKANTGTSVICILTQGSMYTTYIAGNEIGVRVLNDGSLQLEHTEAEDAGKYLCNATNIAGSSHHIIDLKVYCKF